MRPRLSREGRGSLGGTDIRDALGGFGAGGSLAPRSSEAADEPAELAGPACRKTRSVVGPPGFDGFDESSTVRVAGAGPGPQGSMSERTAMPGSYRAIEATRSRPSGSMP